MTRVLALIVMLGACTPHVQDSEITIYSTSDHRSAMYFMGGSFYYGPEFESSTQLRSFLAENVKKPFLDSDGCLHYGPLIVPKATSGGHCSGIDFTNSTKNKVDELDGRCISRSEQCLKIFLDGNHILGFKFDPEVPESKSYNLNAGRALTIG